MAKASVKKQELLIQELKEHYILCKYCFDRQVPFDHYHEIAIPSQCYICHGLMYETDSIIDKILNVVDHKYQFNTFLIGATLPTYLYELEDQIRARFKIRGRENIKNQLTRELRKKFKEITKSKIDYLCPDIVINLQFGKEGSVDVAVMMRPLIIFARYIKRNRGIPQRRGNNCKDYEDYEHYEHKGYNGCSSNVTSTTSSDVSDKESIQTIIAKELLTLTKGNNLKFSWVGSEDSMSLVLGKGRPFFVQIMDPKINQLKKNNLKFSHYGVYVNIEKYYKKLPKQPIEFITKTKILIRASRSITENEVKRLNSLSSLMVTFFNKNKSKTSSKRIYSINVKKITDRAFELILIADGGLAIKQFVEGREYMNPNISENMGIECECVVFDILDVCIRQ